MSALTRMNVHLFCPVIIGCNRLVFMEVKQRSAGGQSSGFFSSRQFGRERRGGLKVEILSQAQFFFALPEPA
jgi:hypothetical protein